MSALSHLSNISEGYWKKPHSSEGGNKISTFSDGGMCRHFDLLLLKG